MSYEQFSSSPDPLYVDKLQQNKLREILSQRQIIEGPSDSIRSATLSKYEFAPIMLEQMQANEWHQKTPKLDKDNYQDCQPGTKSAVTRALAFLTNLDGIQLENLMFNVVEHITDPNIRLCIARQIWEEALHVAAYDKIIRTYYNNPLEVYALHEFSPELKEKNAIVLAQANRLKMTKFTPTNFIYALVANIILEGIYFHNGFSLFYIIERLQRKLAGASDMVKYIQRDETTHCSLFTKIFKALWEERPELFTSDVISNILELFDNSVNLEKAWGKYIIQNGVPGTSERNTDEYTEFLADKRLVNIGIKPLYNTKNPYPWIEEFAGAINKAEKNFFETTVTSYSKDPLNPIQGKQNFLGPIY